MGLSLNTKIKLPPHVPVHLKQAWVTRLGQIKIARRKAADAERLYQLAAEDPSRTMLRHHAAQLDRLAKQLAKAADRDFTRALTAEYKDHFAIAKPPIKGEPWFVEAWYPYHRDKAVTYRFCVTTKPNPPQPKTFCSIMELAKKKTRGA